MKTKNKFLPILLIFSMTISLIGCGSSINPVAGEDVAESTETTVESTESTVDSSNEATTETGGKGDAVVEEEKTSETPAPKPTTKPATESAEKPETPQSTATPEPTAPPHTHEYTEAITKQPTCAEAGVKTLTCSCGDVKTEAISATGNHNWVEEMEELVIPSTGHVEEVQVQVGTGPAKQVYECAYCGHQQDHPISDHTSEAASAGEPIDHAFARTIIHDIPGEPIYETQSTWIVDVPEQTSVVGTGRFTCSVCGATK